MEKVLDDLFELGESPRYTSHGLMFVDVDHSQLWRLENGQKTLVWNQCAITSFVEDVSGGLVCGTRQGLYYLEADNTAFRPLTTLLPMKINDMGADPAGRVIFGTNYHSGKQRYPLGTLYSYFNGELRELDYGLHLSNGIGFSPDGKTMYVCDSSVRTVFAYPYDPATGNVGRKEIFIRFRMDDGIPDGMAIDDEGNIWTAQWYGHCVICTAPDGTEVKRIPVPAAQVSAVEFSPDGLYITSAHEHGRLDIAPHAFDPDAPGVGGELFLTDPGVKGHPHARSNIFNK